MARKLEMKAAPKLLPDVAAQAFLSFGSRCLDTSFWHVLQVPSMSQMGPQPRLLTKLPMGLPLPHVPFRDQPLRPVCPSRCHFTIQTDVISCPLCLCLSPELVLFSLRWLFGWSGLSCC